MVGQGVQDYATLLLKQSDGKSGKLTADRGPCSSRSGRNVSKITASVRVTGIGGKSGEPESESRFWKRTGRMSSEGAYRANAVCQSRSAFALRLCVSLDA